MIIVLVVSATHVPNTKLRTFFARRGVPSKILFDYCTQFVAEQTQLFASDT